MIRCDALIVGGGPAGSTCARQLRLAGWDVVVVDRETFPRDKVCAGWVTPGVFSLLDLDPAEYRATGLTIQEIRGFRTGVVGTRLIETPYQHVVSYAIRRCEFDHFLLRRAGVRVMEGTALASLRRQGGTWIANDQIAAPVVVGAGGHFCPVARQLRRGADLTSPVVAKEAEFRLNGHQTRVRDDTPELFFCHDLQGYGWCVRKGEYLNVGIGRRDSRDFAQHVRSFVAFLERTHVLSSATHLRWRGHAYLASGTGVRPIVDDGVLLAGDAVGLAYPESGEGIRPAIESGYLAARTLIDAAGRYGRDQLRPYADVLVRRHPPSPVTVRPLRSLATAVGRMLLSSPGFTRHVVLDRWFLRA